MANAQLVTHLLDQWPVQGIDLSKWNDRPHTTFVLDPKVLLRAGYRFASVKVSQGVWKDPKFDIFWKILRETSIEVFNRILKIDRFGYGFVDYSNYDRDVKGADTAWGIRQGKYMASVLKPDPGELPPYIDLETNAIWFAVNFWNYRPVMNVAYAMVHELSMSLGYLAGVYSNQGMYPYFGSAMKDYPQWLSWYNDMMTSKKNVDAVMTKYGFKRGWTFLQHASDGDVDNNGSPDGLSLGVDSPLLDLNVFNGDEEAFQLEKSKPPAVVIPPTEDPVIVPLPDPLPIPGEGLTRTIQVKTVVSPVIMRSAPYAGNSNTVFKVMPVGTPVECLERITRPGEIWWRIGQGQFCAELYNGTMFLR